VKLESVRAAILETELYKSNRDKQDVKQTMSQLREKGEVTFRRSHKANGGFMYRKREDRPVLTFRTKSNQELELDEKWLKTLRR
jgi:hypothetical protein